MTKRLWTVEVTSEIAVLAEDRASAEKEARKVSTFDLERDYDAREMMSIPWGWEDDCIPYGSDEETLGELIESGCAPALKAARERHEREMKKFTALPATSSNGEGT